MVEALTKVTRINFPSSEDVEYQYYGNSIDIRNILPHDARLLHDWLQLPEFAFYRPNLLEMCPNVLDLINRMVKIRECTPSIEIEVLIEQSKTHIPIGIMSLSGIDTYNRKAEFSMGFVRGQGTRCTMEAFHFGLEKAFSSLDFRKLIFYITDSNKRALRFIDHCQIQKEGLLYEELLLSSGKTLDLHRYSLLQSAWEKGYLQQTLQRTAPLKSWQ